jgi:hypothetical protein
MTKRRINILVTVGIAMLLGLLLGYGYSQILIAVTTTP